MDVGVYAASINSIHRIEILIAGRTSAASPANEGDRVTTGA